MVTGRDNNVWFTETVGGKVGKITTAGVITEYAIPTAGAMPHGITAGPDGNLWFTETGGNKIGEVTPAGVFTEYPVSTVGAGPAGIATGADGNLWFTESGAAEVGRITTGGVITEFPWPGGASQWEMTAGPDGNLWFSRSGAHSIGRVTTAGVVTDFPNDDPDSGPSYIGAGPDGNVWYSAWASGYTGRHGDSRRRRDGVPVFARASRQASSPGPTGTSGSSLISSSCQDAHHARPVGRVHFVDTGADPRYARRHWSRWEHEPVG